MIDLFGLPLNVGDEILYTTGSQGNTRIGRGVILEVDKIGALIRTQNGREASVWRGRHELVSVTPFKQLHPELFI